MTTPNNGISPRQRPSNENESLLLYDDDDNSDTASYYDAIEEELMDLDPRELLSLSTITCVLSTAFAYGCIMTTLFMITLPIECERIQNDWKTPKALALGVFVALAGLTQLISPFVGTLSDTYVPPNQAELGQRLPYLILGSICAVIGLLGQTVASVYGFWYRYSVAVSAC
jgi:hypothetical protein